jgi:hypothetical protein
MGTTQLVKNIPQRYYFVNPLLVQSLFILSLISVLLTPIWFYQYIF